MIQIAQYFQWVACETKVTKPVASAQMHFSNTFFIIHQSSFQYFPTVEGATL